MVKDFILITTTEETTFIDKQLLKEAEGLGLNTIILDPKDISFSIDNSGELKCYNKGIELKIPKDAILYRKSLLKIAKSIEKFLKGKGVFSFSRKSGYVRNQLKKMGKFSLYTSYAKNGVGIPESYLITHLGQIDSALKFFKNKFPLIVKKTAGTHGAGIFIIESKRALKPVIEYLLEDEKLDAIILQEFISSSEGTDIRVVVLGGEVVAAVLRDNKGNDFRSNVYQGATAKVVELTAEQRNTAIKALETRGIEFGGVDVLFAGKKSVITEVNSPCDYSFVEKTTGIPISKKIIEFLMKKAEK